ncbi:MULTISPECIES: hypothetical protein [unclassified Natronococcus]|uniref:hypothetical protein n=1 Tax=unclassified Natronococcus TaxID=2623058 RepID=UPI00241CE70C|nr:MULTISPECIES: hypothetical protein [unclassified Natronococcus]MDG5817630.1 hypothetical protein [Natronococcus sp. A-GB7]
MDFTQIVLGLALLAVSSLTFAGPSALESHVLVYALTGSALVIGAGALCADLARDARV